MLKIFRSLRNLAKMSEVSQRIRENAELAEKTLSELKNELNYLKQTYAKVRLTQLQNENYVLINEIQKLKSDLIKKETERGVVQIPVPGINETPVAVTNRVDLCKTKAPLETRAVQSDTVLQKKPKKEKLKAEKAAPAPATEPPVDVGRLDFRVGKIVHIEKHPDADTLYVEQIDCGEEKPRTVCSGLVKYIPMEEMQDRYVVILCNLKPVKMRGVTSEAMVMCASSPDKVEVLAPPPGSNPGDIVECEGYERQPDAQLNPKKKIFETVAPDLKTDGELVACYKGKPLIVPGKGKLLAQTLVNAQVK